MVLRKSEGYVLLVDIDGFGGMKNDLNESEWVPIMNEFYSGCKKAIRGLIEINAGSGTIIGDGFIIFSETMDKDNWLDYVSNTVRLNLLERFNKSIDKISISHLDLTFVTGYCDFYIRDDIDVIGLDIDELFSICRKAAGNELLFNNKF